MIESITWLNVGFLMGLMAAWFFLNIEIDYDESEEDDEIPKQNKKKK